MKNYLKLFIPFIATIAVILFVYLRNIDVASSQISWLIFAYFCVITFAFHLGIVLTTQSRPQVFIRYFMGATTVKLFMHIAIIVVYSLFHREMATRFILTFLIMYLFFTVFEVIAVWRKQAK